MNYSTYRFSLEIQSTQSQVSLPVTLGDTARRFYITLTDGGKPYVMTDGCRAALAGHKADGTSILHDCIIEKNAAIRYDFQEQTASALGKADCSIMLYGEYGELLASPKFSLVVYDDVVGVDVVSEDDLASIGRILAGEQQRVVAEEERALAFAEAIASAEAATANANDVAGDMQEKLDSGYFNGTTPHIGENGHWWLGNTDTGVRAEGIDGGGFVPYIGENGNWWIADEDTTINAEGVDGITPRIGDNLNWWIGDTDTGAYAYGMHYDEDSYTGTGTYGEENPNTLTFDFRPKLVVINGLAICANGSFNYVCRLNVDITIVGLVNSITDNGDGTYTLSWHTDYSASSYNEAQLAVAQLNTSGSTYNYVAIG